MIVANLAYEVGLNEPEALLERYDLLRSWAEGVQAAGAQVSVIQRCRQEGLLTRDGVRYRFVADGYGAWLRRWQASRLVTRAVLLEGKEKEGPPVVHLNGLVFPGQARQLRRVLAGGTALAVQHHAECPGNVLRRMLGRWGFAGVEGFLFSHRDLAQEWIRAGIIPSQERVYTVMGTSTRFRYKERLQARAITGLHGDPLVLWAGNLKANKDPMTILAGFERILEEFPQARLYMAFREADLLAEVQGGLKASPKLAATVRLLGTIATTEMEDYFNSADLFVQGSYREGSGLALLEALACGTIPVVTNIPTFQTLTEGGRLAPVPARGRTGFYRSLPKRRQAGAASGITGCPAAL